jgi:serine/threonine-protein kinase
MGSNDIYIGQMLDNRYEILEKIGTGGMAVVYKARCHRLNRNVAIKVLRNDLAQDESIRKRFRAESQAVAMMSHPNIVGVYDVCRSDGIEYIVMELIEGITLKQYITRKGVLTWKEVLHFSIQIAKALSHAHSRGIIHRDIKPHNIMILKDGSVKVADFGIAQLLNAQNTLTNQTFGSVHYISPEQAKGAHVDARSDLYSVGVVMYEMLTGKLPFEGDTAVSIAIQHINSIPVMPREINPEIPVGMEQITMHAMEPNANKRYLSADELLHDLEEFRKNPDMVFDYKGSLVAAEGATQKLTTVSDADLMEDGQEKPLGFFGRIKQYMQNPPKEESPAKARRRSARTSMLVGTLCCVLFLVVLFMFIWNYFLKQTFNNEDERVIVPHFIGMQVDNVTSSREYLIYYNFEIVYESSETIPEGQIMDQNPEPGRQMTIQDDGINIELTVSSGTETVKMPDILNTDYREAMILLKNLNLDLDIILQEEFSEDITPGYVMVQFPEKGDDITKGSKIYITYSSGPEIKTHVMPDLEGNTQEQAVSILESMNLSYSVERVDNTAAAGTVVWQNVSPGTEVPEGTRISISVSNGSLAPSEPEPEPEPQPQPQPEPEPEPEPQPQPEPEPDDNE